MNTQTVMASGNQQTLGLQPKLQELRAIYADAPEMGRIALDKIMGELEAAAEGYPGMHSPSVRDWIAPNQITADAWYVANPNLTVAETRRLERVGRAVEDLLDKIE
jgi:hypothetical protein